MVSAISQSESSHWRLLLPESLGSSAVAQLMQVRIGYDSIFKTSMAIMVHVVAAQSENKQYFPGDTTYGRS